MKKIYGFVMAVAVLSLSMVAQAQDLTAQESAKTIHLSAYLGGGTGGIGTYDSRYSFIYDGVDFVYTPKELNGFGFVGRGQHFLNSTSDGTKIPTGSLNGAINTGRVQLGLVYMKYDEETEWWIYSATAAGWDFEERNGYGSGAVISQDLSFGGGFFSNELNSTFKVGDTDRQAYWIRDRMYFRLTNWFAFGPQVTMQWFNQWDEGSQSLKFVHEPSYGGQVRFTENSDDPRFGLIIDGAYGDWVGSSWGAGFYYRF